MITESQSNDINIDNFVNISIITAGQSLTVEFYTIPI
jgi:hypothetical protein